MIYILFTTSINNKDGINNYEHRRQRYIESIEHVLKLIESFNNTQIKPIIVENNGIRKTYLDELGCDVLYTENNINKFSHKGVNELLDIKDVIHKYNIKEDDLIIKVTGRYKILDDTFFRCILENIERNDAFVKFFNVCSGEYLQHDCVLGLFAIKCRYLKCFEYHMCDTMSPE